MASRPTLYLLTGPTAVGKTELALRWAERRKAEILSCDSLLFYRGMNIGTAKPTAAELSRVPHHLIDVCPPQQAMDVVRYVEKARAVVEHARARGVPLLIAGGSGFYLRAFFGPISDGIQVSDTLRAEVEALRLRSGLPGLLERLRALNPDGLGALDVANPRRVVRALERCLASGRPLAEIQAAFASMPGPFADFSVQGLILDRPNEELFPRVRKRVEQMIGDGLIDEVRALLAAGLQNNASAAGAIGYRETIAYLNGQLDRNLLVDTIAANTRSLIKKQRTWFRTQLPLLPNAHPQTVSPETVLDGGVLIGD